jgi:hypothetical protein
MKSYQLKGFISALLSVFLLISCGSGGGGMTAGGGIGGSGVISSGAISAFGSVFVNGTEFDTSNAAIIVNGEEVGVGDEFVQENLNIGQVVTVEGTGTLDDISAVAVRVIYNDNVRGPVESIDIDATDPTTKKIVVLGQTVIVNIITKFKETNFGDLVEDDVVAVSGYIDDNGFIRATFLEKTGDITSILEFEVTGFVENLDPDLKTFMINGLKINYSSIANDLPQGIPADDLFVEVEGRLAAGGEMLAMTIELADELGGEDGDEFEIMGFVTDIVSDFEFMVGNQMVQFDTTTLFVDGTPEDILLGAKLEAEGSLENGILIADEIEFWQPDQIEVEGIVDRVFIIDDFPEFTFEGRDDQVMQTNEETEFEDINKEEIEAGINLEVKGVPQDIEQSVIKADKVSFEID